MKKLAPLLGAALLLSSASWGRAADQPSTAPDTQKPKKQLATSERKDAPKAKQVALTGSYIKRDIHRNGQITDGMNPVLVIDSRTIQNSGASDLRQLLVHQGVNR